uniref:F208B n=1 Tax=Macrostomum lignano TaxID=282301 RepID=A0A1I8FKQ8_9PLAT
KLSYQPAAEARGLYYCSRPTWKPAIPAGHSSHSIIKKSTVARTGRPPAPWGEVELKPDRPFKDEDKETVVPHTCRLKPCHHCSQGWLSGLSEVQKVGGTCAAASAAAQGREDSTARAPWRGGWPALAAMASREKKNRQRAGARLPRPWGNRVPDLPRPAAPAVLLKLKCEWRRRDADFIEEKTDLPDELVRDVSGKLIFLEEDEFNFPYASVNEASAKLLQEAERSYRGQRGVFFVYGFENKLFIEKFS